MKLTEKEVSALCRKNQIQYIPDDICSAMCSIAYRQINMGRWTHGRPAAVFIRDGFPCIRYDDGMWWHYDLANERWF